MAELKPCPFCGGESAVAFASPWFMLKRLHNRYVFAGCRKCGCTTQLYNANNHTRSPILNDVHTQQAKERAIEAWNRRAEDGK
jgi:Lar family restriction alleviation protein